MKLRIAYQKNIQSSWANLSGMKTIFFLFLDLAFGRKIEKSKPNIVVIVTDAFDGRIVQNKGYKEIVEVGLIATEIRHSEDEILSPPPIITPPFVSFSPFVSWF